MTTSPSVVPLPLLTSHPGPSGSPPALASPAVPAAAVEGCELSACGAPSRGLDPSVAARVATHPCYSQDAQQHYARMHLPVARGCNIQCNYCNRKFDCANESRPGVTSTLLNPETALAKVKYVASKVPQLSVVGVAGPGEPLANARRTLGTLELIARDRPDITLCLSTNGLTLPDHVHRIASLGIGHVTVTVNMTDPDVGERIYPWVAFRGRRYTGREAARVLSERQLEGLAALRDRGILCKVNSVMIPGVNDEHLVDVSHTVRGLGAFLHNVMPLVSAPEHGTHFGLVGQRGPTPQELAALQDRCEELGSDGSDGSAVAMGLMRHCRQCRADAVGLLGEDRGKEFVGFVPQPDMLGYDLTSCRETPARIEGRRAAGLLSSRWEASA
jgi:nitrogen fixation protein NifB